MASSSHSHSSHKNKHQDSHHEAVVIAPATSTTSVLASQPNVVSRHTLKNLTKYVDPNVQLDDDTEDMMLVYADDFMERLIEGACKLAKHRKATSVDVQDLETYMERNHNWWLSNNETKEEPIKTPKKTGAAEAHRQRLALIKKAMKKY